MAPCLPRLFTTILRRWAVQKLEGWILPKIKICKLQAAESPKEIDHLYENSWPILELGPCLVRRIGADEITVAFCFYLVILV